jgi:hypothetical protein
MSPPSAEALQLTATFADMGKAAAREISPARSMTNLVSSTGSFHSDSSATLYNSPPASVAASSVASSDGELLESFERRNIENPMGRGDDEDDRTTAEDGSEDCWGDQSPSVDQDDDELLSAGDDLEHWQDGDILFVNDSDDDDGSDDYFLEALNRESRLLRRLRNFITSAACFTCGERERDRLLVTSCCHIVCHAHLESMMMAETKYDRKLECLDCGYNFMVTLGLKLLTAKELDYFENKHSIRLFKTEAKKMERRHEGGE